MGLARAIAKGPCTSQWTAVHLSGYSQTSLTFSEHYPMKFLSQPRFLWDLVKDKRPEVIEKTTIPCPQISNLGVLVHWIPSAGLTHHQTLCLVLPPIITPLIGCSVQVVIPYHIHTNNRNRFSRWVCAHTKKKRQPTWGQVWLELEGGMGGGHTMCFYFN